MTPDSLTAFLARRAEIQERCEKATPGPWYRIGRAVFPDCGGLKSIERISAAVYRGKKGEGEANAELQAAARTDLPLALDALDALVGLLGEAMAVLHDVECADEHTQSACYHDGECQGKACKRVEARIAQVLGR